MQRIFHSANLPPWRSAEHPPAILCGSNLGARSGRRPRQLPVCCLHVQRSLTLSWSRITNLSHRHEQQNKDCSSFWGRLCGGASNLAAPRRAASRNKVRPRCSCCSLLCLPPPSLPPASIPTDPHPSQHLSLPDLPHHCFPTRMKYLWRLGYPCSLESTFHTSFAGGIKRPGGSFPSRRPCVMGRAWPPQLAPILPASAEWAGWGGAPQVMDESVSPPG